MCSLFAASYNAPAQTGFGLGAGFDVGFPGVASTALTVVLALVGLSMLITVHNFIF